MAYEYLREYLTSKGYRKGLCEACGLTFWSRSDSRSHCGNGECKPYESSQSFVTLNPRALRAKLKDFFLRHSEVPVSVLRRASTITKFGKKPFMFAGICAFEKLLGTGPDSVRILSSYEGQLFIENQYCFRFDDLESVGTSGRHCSGFTMTGLHLFEGPNYHFSDRWEAQWFEKLLGFFQELGFSEMIFNEDVWRGADCGGSSIEFFHNGIQIANMVFIDSANGKPREFKILDVGIGFERLLSSLGYPVRYLNDRVYDHLRSLVVGIKDRAYCSKIGIGYSMRKLLERILQEGYDSMRSLDSQLSEIIVDLQSYFDESFQDARLKLYAISDNEQIRLNQR